MAKKIRQTVSASEVARTGARVLRAIKECADDFKAMPEADIARGAMIEVFERADAHAAEGGSALDCVFDYAIMLEIASGLALNHGATADEVTAKRIEAANLGTRLISLMERMDKAVGR